jgi:magnesium transporter
MEKLSHDKLGERVVDHMRRDYTTLSAEQSLREALESLRGRNLAEKIIYFYVVDADGKLVGVVPTRRLLMGRPEEGVADIMVQRVVSIPRSMTVLEACEFFVMYRLLAFPVVDEENKLVGVVDVNLFTDEMLEVDERPAGPDIFQLIGVRIAQGRRGSAWAGFKSRFPWLLCNIAGGIACAFIASLNENFLHSAVILALFMPVVLTLAEGVSMQSMTLTLQGLLEEYIDWRKILRSLRVEMLTSLMLGIACGAMVALVGFAWKRQGVAALAIGLGISCAMVGTCLLGVVLPSVVRVCKGDPKLASGPVVLATADVVTFIFYFGILGWIMR